MNATLLIAALLLTQVQEIEGTVVHVHDGDTAHVQKADGEVVKVRFTLVDTPEIGQPHGEEARDFLREMIDGEQVRVETHGVDIHGRALGEIFFNGESVNRKLVEEGHGWWFYHYHGDATDIGDLEVAAKSAKKGLWASQNPVYPRNWRAGARVDGGSSGSGGSPSGGSQSLPAVSVLAVLANPAGVDEGNETVILANAGNGDLSITGWKLQDEHGGSEALSGNIPARGVLAVTLSDALQLGNSGDRVTLLRADGQELHTLQYRNAPSGKFLVPGR